MGVVAPALDPGLWVRPAGFEPGAPFPTSYGAAARLVEGHYITDYPARWISYACALALEKGAEVAIEAYGHLSVIGGQTHWKKASTRVCAAANVTPVLLQVRARTYAVLAAADTAPAREEEGPGCWKPDEAGPGLRGALQRAHDYARGALASLRFPAEAAWSDGLLHALSPLAAARIRAVPAHPIEGTWTGVRGVLRNYGVTAPEECPAGELVRARRLGSTIAVEAVALESYGRNVARERGSLPDEELDPEPTDLDLEALEVGR